MRSWLSVNPPKSLSRWLPWPRIVGAGFLAIVILWSWTAVVVDPYVDDGPGCIFREWTGLACPGCGFTRATHSFLTGDWGQIPEVNAAFPLYVLLGLWSIAQLLIAKPFMSIRATQSVTYCLVALLVVFALLRNEPWWPWLL